MTKLEMLMVRCGYVKLSQGMRFTAKGMRYLPTWAWRAWNSFLCATSSKHKRKVVELLRFVKKRTEEGQVPIRCGIPIS